MKVTYDYKTGKTEIREFTEEELQEMKKINEKIQKQNEIILLKEQLNATDYKIIKASEYSLLNLECEYDIAALHAERQSLRDKINELEAELEV